MLVGALVIVTALVAAGPLGAAPDQPANTNYEPDNDPQDAKEIGELSFQQRGLTPAGDVDWAKLTILPGSWSADFLAGESSAGRLRLSLYDQNLNFLESNEDDGDALVRRECAVDALPGGLYYLKIEEVSGAELLNYTLIWDGYEDCSQLPDLAPHTWTALGYQYPVVPNSVKGTKTASSTLYAGKPTYFDWFFINNGPGRPPGNYYSRVWVDGDLAFEQKENPINQGSVGGGADWGFVVPSPGWHTVYFEVDSDDDVPERDEGNNSWEMDFYWSPVNGWWAQFYNNQNLTGDPVLVRDDPAVNFNWQANAPAPGVNADYFSVRWEREVSFNDGVYLFTLLRNDGMRFYIDGVPYLNEWSGVQNTTTHTIVESMGGAHDLRVEAMELTGHARASLTWQRCYSLDLTFVPPEGGSVQVSPPPNCDDQYYTEGALVTLTAVPAGGYGFTGWSGAAGGTTNPLVVTMDGDKSITANFGQQCYGLMTPASPGTGGSVSRSPDRSCYTHGTQVTLTAVPAGGYSFTGWSGAAGGTTNPLVVTMDGDKSITANFGQQCYDLMTPASPGTGGSVSRSPDRSCYTHGTQVTLTAVPAGGYGFTGWSGAAGGTTNPLVVTMDGDKSITANFGQQCYDLMTPASPGTGGSVSRSPDRSCYTHGTQVTLTAVPVGGYSFTGWSGDVNNALNPLILTMDSDKALTAHFVQACYPLTITIDPSGGGLVGIQPQPNCGSAYTAGTVVTLTSTPASGYHFSNWSGAIGGSDNPRTITMDEVKLITAHFTQDCYDLAVDIDPGNGGSLDITPPPNCDGTRYSAGTQVTLTAFAASGFAFSQWSGAIGGGNNPRALTMDSDKALTAHFARAIRTSFLSMVSFVPGTGLSCYSGPDESEPNDQPTDAGQPLCLNHTFRGLRDDQRDHFAIDLPTAGELVVRLSTVQNSGGVQLVLLYGSPPYEPADQDGSLRNELQVGLSSAQPGRYLIFVYTSQPSALNPAPYTLQVTFTPDS